jgi:hypothetical protein
MLRDTIDKNRQNLTTLTTLFVILKDFIEMKNDGRGQNGLTFQEISEKYRIFAERYCIREKFYSTYVQRQANENGLFEERTGRYKMRSYLVNDKSSEELEGLCDLIINCINLRNNLYSEFFAALEDKIGENDLLSYKNFIVTLFNEDRFRNYGQIFEVLSYSILKVYFQSFGFELKRFSVSFSNDGGMDFVSSDGVYQVTSSPSSKKISDDLEKLPGIKRVMVLSDCPERIHNLCFDSELVTEVITTSDLKTHFLEWLYRRDEHKPRLLKKVLMTIKEEMQRETSNSY